MRRTCSHLSPCHRVTLSSCHPITVPPCHLVILSGAVQVAVEPGGRIDENKLIPLNAQNGGVCAVGWKNRVFSMPIRFRCAYCNQLMGIARRKAGTVVRCPK